MAVRANRSAVGTLRILVGRFNAGVQAACARGTRVGGQRLEVLGHVPLERVRNVLGTLLAAESEVAAELGLDEELLRARLTTTAL
jgi:hypothetical protein